MTYRPENQFTIEMKCTSVVSTLETEYECLQNVFTRYLDPETKSERVSFFCIYDNFIEQHIFEIGKYDLLFIA